MSSTTTSFLLLALLSLAHHAKAQRLALKNYSLGYRVFEVESVAGTPLTLGRFLQDPYSYYKYLDGIAYTKIAGGGGAIQRVPMLYFTAELHKPAAAARFWQKHTVQVGVVLSRQIELAGLAVGNEEFLPSPNKPNDYTYYTNTYSLAQQQQFLGATLGLNRRFRLLNRLQFLAGLHGQGSVALLHRYKQQWDSTTLVVQNSQAVRRETQTSQLPSLKGKNYFQWQLLVPLGLEAAVYKQEVLVRLEANLGIVGNVYKAKDLASREGHGLGLWLIYQPR